MSTIAESFSSEDDNFVLQHSLNGNTNKKFKQYGRNILKSKENIFKAKTKCNRELKKKLKKYKLRKDGHDDPDVLNVSQCLSLSLKIKSPVGVNNNNINCDNGNINEWRFENYLVKMAKKSTLVKISDKEKHNHGIKDASHQLSQNNAKTAKHEGIVCINISEDENSLTEVSLFGPETKPKEMNAFMLMMNARNKSIGSNSPGKEKSVEITEDETYKRQLKQKRNLALETMAQAKGSLQNKAMEDLKDEKIQLIMQKRANRLKKMLNKSDQSTHKTENKILAPSARKDDFRSCSKQKNIKRHRRFDIYSEKVTKRLKIDCSDGGANKVCNADDHGDVVEAIDETEIHSNCEESNKDIVKVSFNDILQTNKNLPSHKKIVYSDAEFLNKLCPSIKKKESMLSYFVKKAKKSEEEENYALPENCIKVKITSKQKRKKINKKYEEKKSQEININKTSLKSESTRTARENTQNNYKINKEEVSCKAELLEDSDDEFLAKLVKKHDASNRNLQESIDQSKTSSTVERRSKRVSKKPVKYQGSIESPCAQSSDHELEMFSLDKAKSTKISKIKTLQKEAPSVANINDLMRSETQSKENYVKNNKSRKNEKVAKLAPIFGQKNQLSKTELEAKHKFLQSGVPEQLKKIIDRQKDIDLEYKCFTIVHHVQQTTPINADFDPWLLKHVDLNLNAGEEEEEEYQLNLSDWAYPHLKFETVPSKEKKHRKAVNIKDKLELVKQKYPKFPVYRTFRILKRKLTITKEKSQDIDSVVQEKNFNSEIPTQESEDPGASIWADKFRPSSSSDIIGNFEGVNSLKKWLTTWKETHLDSKGQQTRKRSDSSESSDFYYPSDTDSRDSMKSLNNVLVVTGPVGCGKTSAIYAVATELAMKVIEVNASAKRTGKTILSNLQEATQSHKINRAGTSSENSQNSQEMCGIQTYKKTTQLRTYSKRKVSSDLIIDKWSAALSNSQLSKSDSNRAAMSLILVEDADLVFEQDDGFVSALIQITQISKRPVIIVTSSLTCPHLQRFITHGNVIKFHNLSPKMLGTWLDILCLVENADIWLHMGQKLLNFCKGDMRKAMNTLQFWKASEQPNAGFDHCEFNETSSQHDCQRLTLEDECSSISWADQEQNPHEHKDVNRDMEDEAEHLNTLLFKTFISFNDHDIGINNTILQFPVDHLNIWWNIPLIFNFNESKSAKTDPSIGGSPCNEKNRLSALSKLMDSISASDLMYSKMTPTMDTSVTSNPWRKNLCDSVSETVDLSAYNRSRSIGDSMSYALLSSSLSVTKKSFRTSKDVFVDCTLPGMAETRSRDKTIGRHKGLCDGLPLSSHLDRRGVALDYMSTCREICRIEKDKSERNVKRNNRFCHYLKSLKVSCSSEALEMLCESLGPGCSVQSEEEVKK